MKEKGGCLGFQFNSPVHNYIVVNLNVSMYMNMSSAGPLQCLVLQRAQIIWWVEGLQTTAILKVIYVGVAMRFVLMLENTCTARESQLSNRGVCVRLEQLCWGQDEGRGQEHCLCVEVTVPHTTEGYGTNEKG